MSVHRNHRRVAALCVLTLTMACACGSQSDESAADPRCKSLNSELLRSHGFVPDSLHAGQPAVGGYPACTWRATSDTGSLTLTMDVPGSQAPKFSANFKELSYCADEECPADAKVMTMRTEDLASGITYETAKHLVLRRDHWPTLSEQQAIARLTDFDALARRIANHVAAV